MYATRLSQNFVPQRAIGKEKICTDLIRKSRQFSQWHNSNNLKDHIIGFIQKARVFKKIIISKTNPEKTLKIWAQQLEFVFAQRVRRGQQMLCLYSRWWEERALKEFIKKLRINLQRNGRELMIGAMGVSAFNWDEKRIKDEEFQTHLEDLNYINALKEATMCLDCSKGVNSNNNRSICRCGSGGVTNKTFDDWVPFIEKDNLVVWRRPHGSEGLFEYKVYGSYPDVSAEDFLNTQVDTDYRKEWDTTAVQLEIGEKDTQPESNSDILYWEMQWPRLFVNRDYVFNRRFKIFQDSKMIVIINKTTEYSKFPKYPDKFRVEDYWSCMVIKPYKEMNELGIEFSLTYFDNPGVNIPGSVTTWVAKSAMPDYLSRLRFASRNYMEYCLKKGTSKACEIYRDKAREKLKEEERNKLEYCSNEKLRIALRQFYEQFKNQANEKFFRKLGGEYDDNNFKERTEVITPEQQSSNNNNNTNTKSEKFWKYLHPLYYFS